MDRSPARLRALAAAMLILGFLVELVGVALMAMHRPISGAIAVLVAGLMLVMLGVVFLSQAGR